MTLRIKKNQKFVSPNHPQTVYKLRPGQVSMVLAYLKRECLTSAIIQTDCGTATISSDRPQLAMVNHNEQNQKK
jgi:hypothetical protein